MVNHSDKVNIITKVYGDKINTNFDSKVNQFGNDGAMYALILTQEQLTIVWPARLLWKDRTRGYLYVICEQFEGGKDWK